MELLVDVFEINMGGSGSVFFLLLDHKKRFTLRGWVGLSKVLKLTLPYQDESYDDDNPNCKMIIMIKMSKLAATWGSVSRAWWRASWWDGGAGC